MISEKRLLYRESPEKVFNKILKLTQIQIVIPMSFSLIFPIFKKEKHPQKSPMVNYIRLEPWKQEICKCAPYFPSKSKLKLDFQLFTTDLCQVLILWFLRSWSFDSKFMAFSSYNSRANEIHWRWCEIFPSYLCDVKIQNIFVCLHFVIDKTHNSQFHFNRHLQEPEWRSLDYTVDVCPPPPTFCAFLRQ